MASEFLVVGAQKQLERTMSWCSKFAILALLCSALACLALSESCYVDGAGIPEGDDGCRFYKDNYRDVNQGQSVVSSDYLSDAPLVRSERADVCQDSELFCFPSTLYGLSLDEHNTQSVNIDVNKGVEVTLSGVGSYNSSWLVDSGLFKLSSGRTVSCSLHSGEVIHGKHPGNVSHSRGSVPSCDEHRHCEKEGQLDSKNVEVKTPQPVDGSHPCVQISHHQLNWGRCNLYHPSATSVSIKNTCNGSALYVYEPFSTDSQFYLCNFTEVQLSPGEAVSLCFVFLPARLGLSSAQLIVQTSSGGFLVPAEGFGVESPYKITDLYGLGVSSSGWWRTNVSLFNPFDEAVQLEEVGAQVSILVGNSSLLAKAMCQEEGHDASYRPGHVNAKKWLDVSVGHGFPSTSFRPPSDWLIGPQATGSIMDIAFLPDLEGKIVGTMCLQLRRVTMNKTETLIVPVEGVLNRNPSNKDHPPLVLVSVEAVGIYETSKSDVFAVSVRNTLSDLLRVVKITEVSANKKSLQIKYSEGLLLFPNSVTQVALVTVGPLNVECENPSGSSNCKILVMTNSSFSPQLDIPCREFFHICPEKSPKSSSDYGLSENVAAGDRKDGPPRHIRTPSPAVKMLLRAEADEHVLKSWRTQGSSRHLTLLDKNRVVFPVVSVGKHLSKFIRVENPSHEPVAVQLIMNSAQIIDNCSIQDANLQPLSSSMLHHNNPDGPTRYGFSTAKNAVMDAHIHPYGSATLGPVFFHPSNRCEWKSSVLIRNNLSGVEFLSLKGYGGSFSLLLQDGSEIARKIEFDLNLSVPLNVSPANTMANVDDGFCGCHKPFPKELLLTNNGDLPISITGIYVSGVKCQSHGFQVHNCMGFSLDPGESAKIQVSYRADFASSVVERDLELAFDSGRLVIPMKASVPLFMINSCRKTFSFRVRKGNVAPLLAVPLMFGIICFLLSHIMALSSLDGFTNTERNSISIVEDPTKSSGMNHSRKSATEFSPSKTGTVENSGEPAPLPSPLSSETVSLTVRTGKDKGRRRRKKKGTAGGSLAGLAEAASSHSGASTPSSPLSPVLPFTPKHALTQSQDEPSQPSQLSQPHSPFSPMARNQQKKSPEIHPGPKTKPIGSEASVKGSSKPTVPKKSGQRPALLQSATFPVTGRSSTSSTSVIGQHARAPGSRLHKLVQAEGNECGLDDKFRYDIWGNHFSGIHLGVKANEVRFAAPCYVENDSNSFFTRGPQTLVRNAGSRPVSSSSDQGG